MRWSADLTARSLPSMNIFGVDSIAQEIEAEGYFVKVIINSSAACFFPGTIQHRDIKREGLSYEDDYQGNALAATLTKRVIDVRFHSEFSDETVTRIFESLLNQTQMEWARNFRVRYQGRELLN
jgi:hypothetical protein